VKSDNKNSTKTKLYLVEFLQI